jgi:hypothetical protein
MTIHRGPRSGYWHYGLLFVIVLAFVIAALVTNYFGLKP